MESLTETKGRNSSPYRTFAGAVAIQTAWTEWQASFAESAEVWEFAQKLVDAGLAETVSDALPMAFKAPQFKSKGLKMSTCSPAELQKLIRAAVLRPDIDQTVVFTALVQALVATLPQESVSVLRDRVSKLSEE